MAKTIADLTARVGELIDIAKEDLNVMKELLIVMRKNTAMVELAMKVNSGELPMTSIDEQMSLINQRYRQRKAELDAEGAGAGT